MANSPWGETKLELRRQMFKLIGANFRISDSAGNLVLFSHQKGFKLKEDIRIYSDESMSQELLIIKARQILDFSAAYDVWDPVAREKVGALKRQGLKSIVRDEWIMMDAQDREIGKIIEDSMLLALLRRFATNLIPQNYDLVLHDGTRIAEFRQHWNPFIYRLALDLSMDGRGAVDPRLKIGAAVLLAAIEGRQG
ncbi:MAG: hypothetical protein IH944_06260 [Armatimonadetes bacterium]|nr:hypothetical protein [Armatimonadota bacterium]